WPLIGEEPEPDLVPGRHVGLDIALLPRARRPRRRVGEERRDPFEGARLLRRRRWRVLRDAVVLLHGPCQPHESVAVAYPDREEGGIARAAQEREVVFEEPGR